MVFFFPEEHRRYGVVLRAVTGVIAVLATVFLAWFEFGGQLFHSLAFWAILALWILFGWFSFLNAWDRAGDNEDVEKIKDKLDDLLDEIKGLRSDLKGK